MTGGLALGRFMWSALETPSALIAFAAACVPLAVARDHEAVSGSMRELIAAPDFAASVPAFDEVDPSPQGFRLGGEHVVHQSDELTVMVLDTLPDMLHRLTTVIGVFQGWEHQRFFARTVDGVAPASTRSLVAGDVIMLGEQALHAISSPAGQAAARAIHVYFGDIFGIDRSLFHPETLQPHPCTSDRYDEFCRAQ